MTPTRKRTRAGVTLGTGVVCIGVVGLLLIPGCGPALDEEAEPGQDELSDGGLTILYRGQVRVAERRSGHVFIEGDIEVAPQELHVVRPGGGTVGSVEQAVRIQGAGYQWPSATIPFVFNASLSAAQRTSIQTAMTDWEDVVPGLAFVARGSEADYVELTLATNGCSSSVGHVGGRQWIRLTTGCIGTMSTHHEIGHALGLYHEHTRKDRGSFIRINWGNIQGCPSTATQKSDCGGCTTTNAATCGCTAAQVTAGNCDMSHNFSTNSSRANLGPYDYDSLMHYSTTGFSKNGGATITVLNTDPATGALYAIGQRNHFSNADISGVRAMYPVIKTHRSVFHDTGRQRVCFLEGREDDVASRHYLFFPRFPYMMAATDGEIDTASFSEGDHAFGACQISSPFWAGSYDYPNTTEPSPGGSSETYSHGDFTIKVLNRGLIGVLTSI